MNSKERIKFKVLENKLGIKNEFMKTEEKITKINATELIEICSKNLKTQTE